MRITQHQGGPLQGVGHWLVETLHELRLPRRRIPNKRPYT